VPPYDDDGHAIPQQTHLPKRKPDWYADLMARNLETYLDDLNRLTIVSERDIMRALKLGQPRLQRHRPSTRRNAALQRHFLVPKIAPTSRDGAGLMVGVVLAGWRILATVANYPVWPRLVSESRGSRR
jgi:hypothetical protein